MKHKMTMILCSCAALAAFTPSLRAATTLLDSTSAAISTSNGLGLDPSRKHALLFSTGSTAYELRSIQFAMRNNNGSLGTDSFTFSLYSGSTPSGPALASQTFSGISIPMTATSFTENLADGFSLAANSNYTLVFASSVSSGALSITSGDTLSGGTSGLTYLGRKFSMDSGSTWNGPFESSTPWMMLSDTAVTTSAVPEASTSLGLLGLAAGGILTRRRTKRAA